MVTKTTTTRPTPRSSFSHSVAQSQRVPSKMSATPLTPPPHIAASVGHASVPHLRSPAVYTEAIRTPSPNYFGLMVDSIKHPQDSAAGPQGAWEATSSILSFDPTSPKHLPLDANPDFEAFRRQSDQAHAFNLSNLAFSPTSGDQARPGLDRLPTRSETQRPFPRSVPQIPDEQSDDMDVDRRVDITLNLSPSASRQETSLNPPSFFDVPRRESPIHFDSPNPPFQRTLASHLDDRHPRLSLPQNRVDLPSPWLNPAQRVHHRAETLPSSLQDGPAMISPAQVRDMIEGLPQSQFILLDIRGGGRFSHSRIRGAINFCFSTMFLKRPSFTLQRLQDMNISASEAEKARFSQWKNCKYLVVYDDRSTDKKDAASASVVNTLKKFSNEGWKGESFILKGGFSEFSKNYSHLVDICSSHASKTGLSLGTSGPGIPLVAGGCLIPENQKAANPFFNNIRQNQDLIGGVGQLDIKMPPEILQAPQSVLPKWLLKAADKENHGKSVADTFLRLEEEEKSRMTKAYAYETGVLYAAPCADPREVQIAGLEKGNKNRYKDIYPFEHARVKLQGCPKGACDYVNASHIKSSRTNKRYIASQGPLPATFGDFWSVVWDQDVRVIVMLTAESEGGQLKCHPYWSSNDYGPLKLRVLSEKKVSLDTRKHRPQVERERGDSGRKRANTTAESAPPQPAPEPPHTIIRKFTLSHAAHPFLPMREITQVHYSSWPDFGAPASPGQLLGLVELSNVLQHTTTAPTESLRSDHPESDEESRPILVHCSAGCGRTGTFCTIDSVIDMLKRQRKELKSGVVRMDSVTSSNPENRQQTSGLNGDWLFDQDLDLIEKTVEDFRGQRLSMVQSLSQYVLCYETVLEWISQQSFGTSKLKGQFGHERRSSDGSY